MKTLNHSDVLDFLPHREPFLFVDTLEDLSVEEGKMLGGTIIGHFFVREDLPLFQGHFPSNPIFPGVIQIEVMAQTACCGLRKMMKDEERLEVALVKVEEAKFRRPIKPGMELLIEVHCTKERGNRLEYSCCIKYQDQIMSEATIWAIYSFSPKAL